METCHIQVGLKRSPEHRWRFLWLWALVGSPGLAARLDRSLVIERGEQGLGKGWCGHISRSLPITQCSPIVPPEPLQRALELVPRFLGLWVSAFAAPSFHSCKFLFLSPAVNGVPDPSHALSPNGGLSVKGQSVGGCASSTFLKAQGGSS